MDGAPGCTGLLASRQSLLSRSARHPGGWRSCMQQSSGDTRRFEYEESREFQDAPGRAAAALSRLVRAGSRREYGLDWRLLAAIGYQESKWDPTRAVG